MVNFPVGARKSTQTFSGQNLSKTLRVMDVRAENRGRAHQKVCFYCGGPGDREKRFDPKASGHMGQECPREIRTKTLCLCCFSSLIQ